MQLQTSLVRESAATLLLQLLTGSNFALAEEIVAASAILAWAVAEAVVVVVLAEAVVEDALAIVLEDAPVVAALAIVIAIILTNKAAIIAANPVIPPS